MERRTRKEGAPAGNAIRRAGAFVRGLYDALGGADKAALLLYFLLHLLLVIFHEAWRDEAEAFVLVRDSSVWEMLYRLSSEGQPLLWFLVVFPFAKLSFPFAAFSAVSLVICTAAAYFLLRDCPFRTPYRLLILFSPVFTYFNPVICRNYCLVLLLTILLAGLWEKRREKPVAYGVLTALLLQTHLYVCGIGIGCLLDMLLGIFSERKEKRRGILAGFLTGVLGLILLIITLYEAPGKRFAPTVNPGAIIENPRLYDIRSQLGILFGSLYRFEAPVFVPILSSLVLALLVLLTVLQVMQAVKRREDASLFDVLGTCLTAWCGLVACFVLAVYVRVANHAQLSICLLVILLFAVWTARPDPPDKSHLWLLWNGRLIFFLLLLLGLPRLFQSVRMDVTDRFSNGKAMASWMRENLPDSSVVLVRDDYCIPSVSAFVPHRKDGIGFWDVCLDEPYVSYCWGYPYQQADLSAARTRFADRELYYLTSFSYDYLVPAESMEAVHAEEEYSIMDERYYLYRVP